MSVGHESLQEMNTLAVQGTADVLTSAADHNGTFDIVRPITLIGIAAVITTATVSTADIVVKMDRRITKGSDTGRGDGDCGILNIPTAIAVGKVVVKRITPVDLDPGDEIVPEVTTAAAGGGAAGGAHYVFLYVPRAEANANCADYVVSS